MTPLLPNPGSLDWQYWWGGGYATAVGVLCFRYRNGVGVAVMAAMMAVDAVVSAGSLPIAGARRGGRRPPRPRPGLR